MTATDDRFYITGGTLPSGAPSYVERRADSALLNALLSGEYCYVLNARQTGKSSLMIRTAERLKAVGVTVAILDLTAVGQNLSPEQWYDGLLSLLAEQLHLEDDLEAFWLDAQNVGPMQRFFAAIKQVVLPALEQRVGSRESRVESRESGVEGERPSHPYAPRRLVDAASGHSLPGEEHVRAPLGERALPPRSFGERALPPRSFAAPVQGEGVTALTHHADGQGDPAPTRIMPESASRLVIFVDEIDVVRSLPFSADEFFAGVRQCYIARAQDSALDRLCFCLLGTATPADLVQDTRVSPFNIGTRIEITDFTPQEATPLTRGLMNPRDAKGAAQQRLRDGVAQRESARLLERVLYWTGGHPYLTQRLCRAVAEQESGKSTLTPRAVDRLCEELFLTKKASEADDNLALVRNRLLKSEADLPSLLDLYQQMRRGKRILDDETNPLTSLLKLSGVAKVENGVLKVRNRIYNRVFDNAWVLTRMPDAEIRRQRAAYRRGMIRAVCLFSVLTLLVGGLAIYAFQLKRKADANAAVVRSLLYAANMKLVQAAWDNNDIEQVQELLDATRNSQQRGWEWNYWNLLAHRRQRHGGLPTLVLRGHLAGVTQAAYARDGARIVTSGRDGTARVWDAETGGSLLVIRWQAEALVSAAYSPDGGTILTTGTDGAARVWDAMTGQPAFTPEASAARVTLAVFSPDGRAIFAAGEDGAAQVWDAATGRPLRTYPSAPSVVRSAAYSPDSKHILLGCEDGTARIWDAETGRETLTLRGHTRRVNAVAYSPDGKRIVTGSADGTAQVWDAADGRRLYLLKRHTASVRAVGYSPDGKRIVTGGEDRAARVWDADGGHEVLALRGHTGVVDSAGFSPDGQHILTGSEDGTARVWFAGDGADMEARKP